MEKSTLLGKDTFDNITAEDYNNDWERYREVVRKRLSQALHGFIGGILYVLICMGLAAGITEEPNKLLDPVILLFALLGGIACIGFPYGWEVVNKLVGQWSVYGHILVVLPLFLLKVGIAFIIGMFGYPASLIYNLIKSQKSKRRIKRAWTIVAILIAVHIVLFGVLFSIESSINQNANASNGNAAAEPVQRVTASTFAGEIDVFDILYQKALQRTQESESKYSAEYGWEIVHPSKIYGAFFVEDPHDESHEDFSNALIFVGAFYIGDGGSISIDRWELRVWVYPELRYDENGVLSHAVNGEQFHAVAGENVDDAIAWVYDQYEEMTITELDLHE